MRTKFDLFVKPMSVVRKAHEWHLFNKPCIGIRTRVYDVVIPMDLKQDELGTHLEDIYHEHCSIAHRQVTRLT
ncbi:DUF7661 family protein [Shewanella sp. 0m-8]